MTKKPLKNFGKIQAFLSLILMPCGFLVWGLVAIPGIWMFQEASTLDEGPLRLLAQGAAVGMGLMFWCLLDLFVMGFIGMIMRPRSGNAQAPTQSWLTIRWGFMSLLQRLALPALKWFVPSFIADIYYRMIGAKVGRGSQLNSIAINDAFMVEIGSKTVIGGDASINAHLFENNGIHLAKVIIGSNCVIGTRSQINPGCVIGDGAVLASKAVLPKHTEIPPGEIWGGIPAKCIYRADGTRPE
ncbi:MAG: hypothetical protein VX473_07610 [Candidatus Thermoplasmatota archaeon]|nr:hypothetical protein [Candidatus Thermoplasmatota archaeon]